MFYENYPLLTDYFEDKRGEYDAGFSFPSHLHQCFEFIFVNSGGLEVTVEGQVYKLSPGDGLLIFPYQIHSLLAIVHSVYSLWVFAPQLVQAYATKTNSLLPKSNFFRPDRSLVDRLSDVAAMENIFARKGALYSICGVFDQTACYQERITGPEDLLRQIFAFVEEHYADECTLADLAKDTAYDYAYLSRYFKRLVGMSYTEYINCFRIRTACYLLKNRDRPIIKIAYEVGFHSLRSFNRNFKELMGITPGEYRLK